MKPPNSVQSHKTHNHVLSRIERILLSAPHPAPACQRCSGASVGVIVVPCPPAWFTRGRLCHTGTHRLQVSRCGHGAHLRVLMACHQAAFRVLLALRRQRARRSAPWPVAALPSSRCEPVCHIRLQPGSPCRWAKHTQVFLCAPAHHCHASAGGGAATISHGTSDHAARLPSWRSEQRRCCGRCHRGSRLPSCPRDRARTPWPRTPRRHEEREQGR